MSLRLSRHISAALTFTVLTGCGGFEVSNSQSDLPSLSTDLAAEAAEILLVSCSNCHSNEASSGGVGHLLSAKDLIAARMIVPGAPESSSLFQSIAQNRMPLGEPLDERSKTVLAQWIRNGAKEFPAAKELTRPRTLIPKAELIELILKDLRQIPEDDRQHVRYLTLDHALRRDDLPDVQKVLYPQSVAKVINSLHYRNDMSHPRPLAGSGGAVLRIHLNEIDIPVATWEELISPDYPYLKEWASLADFLQIQTLAGSSAPVVRADWFVRKVTQPKEYQQLLALPDNVTELEERLGVDAAENILSDDVVRLGVRRSRVSFSNRVIERHESQYGAYWKSYDFASSLGSGDIFANPLGPVSTGEEKAFSHDGGEMIFSLPNGLHGYMVTNALGEHLDSGPAEIVRDGSRTDQIVTNSTSCFTCHTAGVISVADDTREYVRFRESLFTPSEQERIYAQYPIAQKIEKVFRKDKALYRHALGSLGIEATDKEPISTVTILYDQALTPSSAAAELGVSVKELQQMLLSRPDLKELLFEGDSFIPRKLFEERFEFILEQL